MINKELIGYVRYPDEAVGGFDDRISYEDVIEAQKILLSTAEGQDKIDLQETLSEFQQLWTKRRASIAYGSFSRNPNRA